MTATAKQLGGDRSGKRAALIEAAEHLMREAGYAALTSRRVADHAGLKHQLIFYYFKSFDDLLLEVLRKGVDEMEAQLVTALEEARPLHALWRLGGDRSRTRLITEFMAMANHNPAIRAEITACAERFRDLQAEALERRFAQHGRMGGLSPVVLTVLTSLLSRGLMLEASLGMQSGHAETEALIHAWLDKLEAEAEAGAGREAAATRLEPA